MEGSNVAGATAGSGGGRAWGAGRGGGGVATADPDSEFVGRRSKRHGPPSASDKLNAESVAAVLSRDPPAITAQVLNGGVGWSAAAHWQRLVDVTRKLEFGDAD